MIALLTLLACVQDAGAPDAGGPALEAVQLRAAAAVAGLELSDDELQLMLENVARNLRSYAAMREIELDNTVPPALVFSPLIPGVRLRARAVEAWDGVLPAARRPADLEELAFADIPTLAALLRSRQVRCVELAELSLARLRRLDPKLHCVISLTEERALEQAATLDRELEEGRWRGPLHGIPYGAKDLLAVPGYRTTWGARPYAEQVREETATVIARLDVAGAVLVAKLSLGALAMGDVWYGETTRNPWNPSQGSSGSSAGSAAATAAGCVPFAIGSETLGSIVSPSRRCGNSSLRPTFGRVSRHGAMALSWSMDKLGPMGRSLHDVAIVFDAIHGADGLDPSAVDQPYAIPARVSVAGWRVGYLADAFERSERHQRALEELARLGVELVPIELPDYPSRALMILLSAEAATAFDELTRSGRDDELVRQDAGAWPNSFRTARLIPAVEYLRANRIRTELMRAMDAVMAGVDAYVHPTYGGDSLGITNLTGHPCAIAPCGFHDDGTPYSLCFTGHLYDETRLLALARAWQEATSYHRRHPELE